MSDDKKPTRKAKVERAHFHVNFYERGQVKYAAGKHYPVTDETKSRAVAGDAEIKSIEVDADEHEAELAAAHARLKGERKSTHEAEDVARKRGELK